eukprot:1028102-Heterocapsa_arctica.AAC.1
MSNQAAVAFAMGDYLLQRRRTFVSSRRESQAKGCSPTISTLYDMGFLGSWSPARWFAWLWLTTAAALTRSFAAGAHEF